MGSFREMCDKQAFEIGLAEMRFAKWQREHPWRWKYIQVKGLICGYVHPEH